MKSFKLITVLLYQATYDLELKKSVTLNYNFQFAYFED